MGQVTLAFGGYAALWDRVDRAGDVVRRGAFAGAGDVPLLWRHAGAAVGRVTVAEDEVGLRVEGLVEDVASAAAVRSGVVEGLSIGFRPVRARQGAWRELLAVELVEVSLVPVPVQAGARVGWWRDAAAEGASSSAMLERHQSAPAERCLVAADMDPSLRWGDGMGR
jgi:uncharacterized protein